MNAINELLTIYGTIIGKRFGDLSESDLRVLYSYELWKDGMDIKQVMLHFKDREVIPIDWIKTQLKNTLSMTILSQEYKQ
jgi:hypothetical protein